MIRLVDYFAVVGYDDCDISSSSNGGEQQQQRRRSGVGKAKIIQRFPVNESHEAAGGDAETNSEEEFDSNVHCFCQPHQGWRLYTKPEAPTFFVSVLTDIRGRRRYCACLNFSEPYRPFKQAKKNNSIMHQTSDGSSNEQDSDSDRSICRQKCTCDESVHECSQLDDPMDNEKSDEEDANELNKSFNNRQNLIIHDHRKQAMLKRQVSLNRPIHQPVQPASLYSAKSLVIISRLDYPDLFKAFLSLIYASYVDKRADNDNKLLEQIVANMLTIQVSAPGTAQLSTFSLSGDDKHCMQAQASLNVPCTDSCVYKLFKELGIGNVLRLVCAVLADYKILFFSRSYIKLYEACKAIEALLYPLKYTGVFVPVLPCFGSFLEFPAAPTPYIIGIHSAFRRLIEDMHQDSLQECVKVDIDCATLSMPQCVDDLINGSSSLSSTSTVSDESANSKNYVAVGSSATSSGITSISSSSSSSFEHQNNYYSGQSYNVLNCNNYNMSSSASKSSGLPHHLYDSTLNLLYALLKPDVLKADELVEFSHYNGQNKQTNSSSATLTDLTSPNVSTLPSNMSNLSINGDAQHSVNSSSSNHTNGPKSTSGCNSANASADIDAIWMDKMLRAVFVRLFAQLFAGYRYCLLVIRINPKPVICFNKQAFLSQHRLSHENEFMNRLLDSMSFQKFIEERGPSYRNCDVFDELYASVQSQLLAECGGGGGSNVESSSSSSSCAVNVMSHLKQIAEKLYKYEYPHTHLLRSNSKKSSRFFNSCSCCSPSSTQNTTDNRPLNSASTTNANENSTSASSVASNSCAIKNYIHNMPYRSYSKIKLPTPDAYRRIYAETFPLLDSAEIERLMSNSTSQSNTTITAINSEHLSTTSLDPMASTSSLVSPRNHLCRPYLVPYGPPIETVQNMSNLNRHFINLFTCEREHFYSKHRLQKQILNSDKPSQVVENSSIQRKIDTISYCVANIFACNFKEVKKTLNSAFRALRDPRAGLHLCECLQAYVKRNQVILINEQFEFVCKLLNEALLNQNRLDEHGLAYAVLPLSSAFYRKLNNGTIDQCIYTRLQQHQVWSNIHFWEMAFYSDVQRSLRPVYLTNEEFHAEQERENIDQTGNNTNSNLEPSSNGSSSVESASSSGHNTVDADTIDEMINQIINGDETSKRPNKRKNSFSKAPIVAHSSFGGVSENLYARPAEKTALEICGEQMETFLQQTDEHREAYIRNEQGIIRSHVLHYITQMVNMKIPFDINSRNKQIASELSLPTPSEAKKTTASINETASIKNDCESSSIHAQMTHSPSNEDNHSLAASDDSGYEPNPIAPSQQDAQIPTSPQQQFLDMDASPEYLHTFGEIGYEVWRFVRKFVDHVCQEGMLSDSQRQALHYNLADVISMQIQMLETVHAESKKVPARTKPPMDQLKPEYMLPGECVLDPTPLRCYMVPDGRDEVCGMSFSGTCLLPAEGVLILTNYRCMFRGIPVNDSLMSDSIITRSFPISALIKEKRCGNSYKLAATLSSDAGHLNEPSDPQSGTNILHDGIQMRSSTFQLIKVYFDEESPTEKVDRFRHLLFKLRYPSSILELFCFGYDSSFNGKSPNIYPNSVALLGIYNNSNNAALENNQDLAGNELYKQSGKESKQDALKHFAKNTLRKAGLMSRNNSNSKAGGSQHQATSSIAARTPETARKSLQSSMRQSSFSSSINSQHVDLKSNETNEEGLSVIEENMDCINSLNVNHVEAKQLERLVEMMPAYKDFLRLGLLSLTKNSTSDDLSSANGGLDLASDMETPSSINHSSLFRICTLNLNYQLCKTLPSIFVVPRESTDDCIRKNAKCHRQGRLPVIMWRHNRNKALLLRASGFHGKGFIGMLIKTSSGAAVQTKETTNETNSSIEQEKLINDIIKLACNAKMACNPLITNNSSLFLPGESSLNGSISAGANACMLNAPDHPAAPNCLYSVTPIVNRRSLFANKIEKAVQTVKNNYNMSVGVSSGHNASAALYNAYNGNYYLGNQNPLLASNYYFAHNDHNGAPNKFNTMASLSSGSHNSHNQSILQRAGLKSQNMDYDTNSSSQADGLNESFCSSLNSACQPAAAVTGRVNSSVPLYIICERSQIKSFRSNTEPSAGRYFFHPIDIHDVKDTKNSFKKLCRACVPSNASVELLSEINSQNTLHKSQGGKNNSSAAGRTFGLANKFSSTNKSNRKKSMSSFNSASQYPTINHIDSTGTIQRNSSSNLTGAAKTSGGGGLFKEIQESKWFEQLQLVMSVSNLIVEKMEDINASVMICLEDGWDFTAQCSSLAQLFMDPYYRTLEGFAVLVEKEWLAMGHRFTRRNNHTIDDQTGFAPIFLQFLDIVYQTLSQFPNAFEFNEFYLEFLAYHYVSNRFKTFLLDSECERVQYGLINNINTESPTTMSAQLTPNMNKFIFEGADGSIGLNTNISYNFATSISPSTCCIWEYIQKVHFNTAKFFNFNYQPNIWRECVLRPSSELYKLKLWSYYFRENLCIGPVYDLDLISISALNNSSPAESKTSANNITKGNLDDCLWYPVPIQNACDYYEQLEQILPSQYEILIKQIIRKYRINEKFQAKAHTNKLASSMSYYSLCNDSFSTFDYLHKILTSSSSTPDLICSDVYINWKALWDYFYQLAENRIIKDAKDHKESHRSLIDETFLSIQQTNSTQTACSLTKPYMTTLPPNSSSILGNKTLELKAKKDHLQPAFILQSSSSSYCSQASPTPPFPKVQDDKSVHNYQIFLFSSTNICKLCNTSFKSTTQYVGLKCKYCSLVCHEQCAKDFPTECDGMALSTQNCSLSEQVCSSKDPRTDDDSYSKYPNKGDDASDDINKSIHASRSSVNSNPYTESRISHSCLPNATKLDIGSACAAGLKNDFRPTTNRYDDDAMGLGGYQQFYPNMELDTSGNNFMAWSQSSNEHQTYAGYLKKQGALFKQWKERYFVLDSIKHQLRYYDSHNDLIVKGVIDLSEVECINQGISGNMPQGVHQAYNGPSGQSSTKKALSTLNAMTGTSFGEAIDPKSCFELKTSKRVYYFCAKSPQEACKWVKQLECCCIDS